MSTRQDRIPYRYPAAQRQALALKPSWTVGSATSPSPRVPALPKISSILDRSRVSSSVAGRASWKFLALQSTSDFAVLK
jgi:hypothetical protein